MAKGFEKVTVAALFREVRRMKCVVRAAGIESDPITRTRSLCQGGPDAPEDFNLALDDLLVEYEAYAKSQKLGVLLPNGKYCAIIMFADNLTHLFDASSVIDIHVKSCDQS